LGGSVQKNVQLVFIAACFPRRQQYAENALDYRFLSLFLEKV
jgi:hypothetical protein